MTTLGATTSTTTFPATAADVGAAPNDAPYLVTTANAGLSAEVVVPAAVLTVLDDTTIAAMRATLGIDISTINFIIDGGGSAITTGIKGDVVIDFACTVTAWDILADQSGSIVVDIWRDSYANFPPVVADTMTGAEKPTLSTAAKNQDTSLASGAGWAIAAGDVLRYNVDSITTCTRVTVSLKVVRA